MTESYLPSNTSSDCLMGLTSAVLGPRRLLSVVQSRQLRWEQVVGSLLSTFTRTVSTKLWKLFIFLTILLWRGWAAYWSLSCHGFCETTVSEVELRLVCLMRSPKPQHAIGGKNSEYDIAEQGFAGLPLTRSHRLLYLYIIQLLCDFEESELTFLKTSKSRKS